MWRNARGHTGAGLAIVVVLVVAVLVVGPTTQGVAAQGGAVADQVNDPTTGSSYGCGSSGASMYQGFTPTLSRLVAVELRLRAGGDFPDGGLKLTINLRELDAGGAILGTATADIVGPMTVGSSELIRYSFGAPVALAVGSAYAIEWTSPAEEGIPAARYLSWMGGVDNPYARGTAFGCSGTPIPQQDLNFITYALPADGPAPSPTPAGPVCPQLSGRVPAAAIASGLANPSSVSGYNQLDKPSLPESPFNRRRVWLSLHNLAVPYHALYNSLVYRAGCP